MNVLNNLTIKSRLLFLVALAAVLMVAIGAMGLAGMRHTDKSLNTVYNDRLVPTGQISRILEMMQDNRTQLLLSLQHDPASAFAGMHDHPIDNHIKMAEENIEKITSEWQAFMARSLTAEEKKLAEDFAAKRAVFIEEGLRSAITLLKAGRYHEANETLLKRVNPSFYTANAAAEKMLQLQLDVAKEEYTKAIAEYELMRNAAITLIAVAIGLSILVTWTIIGGISRAVAELERASGQLAAAAEETSAVTEQTSSGIRQQQSETEQVATAMNEMTATVQEVARSAASAAEAATRPTTKRWPASRWSRAPSTSSIPWPARWKRPPASSSNWNRTANRSAPCWT